MSDDKVISAALNPTLAAWTARFGSGIFLVIQMVILLDFVQQWNDSWVAAAEEDQRWLHVLLGITLSAYAGAVTLAGTKRGCHIMLFCFHCSALPFTTHTYTP